MRLARIFQESGLVALRHHAPVGHFFGVPSGSEIGNAWVMTWNKLNEQWADGSNPMLDPSAPGYDVDASDGALPGLARMVSFSLTSGPPGVDHASGFHQSMRTPVDVTLT